MSWTKRKSSGWASFDLKHGQKQGVEPRVINEPYPPMSNSISSLYPCQSSMSKTDLPVRSFSSVLLPVYRGPTQIENPNGKLGDNVINDHCSSLAIEKLKELHSWASNNLIEDIMVAVNHDIDKASNLLIAMNSTENINCNIKKMVNEELGFTSKNPLCDTFTLKAADKKELLLTAVDHAEGSYASEDYLNDHIKEIRAGYPSNENTYCGDGADMEWILRQISYIPLEPEYIEDDIYLSHRKNALKAMRSASHHSRAASNAFLKGDHLSAQNHSVKAREEWMTAERLNAKAAKEILMIRNSNNDIWKFDLHGLHAIEAIQALKEHLAKIETLIPPKASSILLNGDKNSISVGQKPVSLEVITGRGNHSRGEAALPEAVRSFLIENRYRFNETRPGTITVMPKFRYR